MERFEYKNRSYAVDEYGFLKDPEEWDESYAEGMSLSMGMPGGLNPAHLEILAFIRKCAAERGRCPTLRKICSGHHLKLADFLRLFPLGYEMCACKLAGLTSFPWAGHASWVPSTLPAVDTPPVEEPTVRPGGKGSAEYPREWDAEFAW